MSVPACRAQATFWPDVEACEVECIRDARHDGPHEDTTLGEWTEDELTTGYHRGYVAAYWHHGEHISKPGLTLAEAFEQLWDVFCAADGSPIQITDETGSVVADEEAIQADRLQRMREQHKP